MKPLTLGIMSRSRKPDERRLPIHPLHFDRIDPELRSRIYLENDYAQRFGMTDAELAPYVAGFGTHDELIADCDVILLPKPQLEDVAELHDGQVLWGWPHCVQDSALTQLAIDKHLTLIAFEVMNHWSGNGAFDLHVFHKNNELAGYSSVLHALELIGSTGDYGRRLRAAVIGFGSTARGAVTALNAHGIHDVDVLTNRDIAAVGNPIHSAELLHFDHDGADPRRSTVDLEDGSIQPLSAFLAEHDVIVNCVLQDTADPLTFLIDSDLELFAPGSLIVDVSCDAGMGFSWARPTSFAEPSFTVGNGVTYYAVDHSPSYLWNSSTWENSEAILPYLETVMSGSAGWDDSETIRRAIEIREGVIQNPAILDFQDRGADYPHAVS